METQVKERPILFSGPMVRALLAGTKTQTRRIVKGIDIVDGAAPNTVTFTHESKKHYAYGQNVRREELGWPLTGIGDLCPYGQPGERLWVRETFRYTPQLEAKIKYRADYDATFLAALADSMATWKPSIFMPRTASRLLLEITAVRCERLQDISEADAVAEGVESLPQGWVDYSGDEPFYFYPESSYRTLWQKINGPESWAANPWVWVVEFKVV